MRAAAFIPAISLAASPSLSLPGVQGFLTPTPETIRALVAESKAMPPAPGTVHLDLLYRRSPFRRFFSTTEKRFGESSRVPGAWRPIL